MTALGLWWSFLWRLTAALFVLSFVLHPAAYLLLGLGDPSFIFYRPSVAWWLTAALFWVAGARMKEVRKQAGAVALRRIPARPDLP